MATILKIKRSSTNPTATPSGLGQGELAYGEGTSTYVDAQGATVVSHGKLFVGKGSETNGVAAGLDIIGGKYFTDLLDHGHGTVTANSAVIVDSAKKVDEWNVDNIKFDGNKISTTNNNGDLTIDTNGTGDVILTGAATVGTNLFKINDGSTDRFVVDSFSGAVDITTPELSAADTLLNISSTWNNTSSTFYGIDLDVTNTNSHADSRLLNLSVGGGDKFNVDLSGNVYLTGGISFENATSFNIKDDEADAFVVKEGTNHYIDIDTTNNSELLTLGNTLSSVLINIDNENATAFKVVNDNAGTPETYITINTSDTSGSGGSDDRLITFGTANVDIDNNLNVDGGSITTGQTSFNLLNTTATTVNAFGDATAIGIGKSDANGTTTLGSGTLVGAQATQNVFNTTATTVNAFGEAKSINIGETGTATGTVNGVVTSSSTVVLNSTTGIVEGMTVTGGGLPSGVTVASVINGTNITLSSAVTLADQASLVFNYATTLGSGTLVGTETIQNVFDTTATTVNAFGAATEINIGASGAHTTTLGSGTLVGTETSQSVFNTVATTVDAFGAATTIGIGAPDDNGTTTLGSGTLVGTQATQNVFNTTATTVNAFGAATTINMGGASTVLDLGNIKISGNTISTDSSSATELIIDPFPDAGDAGGDVIIRGNLQVSGTTTTVNSTEMTVNDPVFTLGDSVTQKTVTAEAAAGASDLVIDNPAGVVEGSTITGTNINSGVTVNNIKIKFNVNDTDPFDLGTVSDAISGLGTVNNLAAPGQRTIGTTTVTATGGSPTTAATFDVTVANDGSATVALNTGGEGYAVDDTLTLTASGNFGVGNITVDVASLTNGVDTFTHNGVADGSRTPGVYFITNAAGSASGTGADFTVTVAADGTPTVELTGEGTGYAASETITITDAQLGSGGGANVTVTVTAVTTVIKTVDSETGLTAPNTHRLPGTYIIADSSGNGTTNATFEVVVAQNGVATVTLVSRGAGYTNSDALTISRTGAFGGTTDITTSVSGTRAIVTAGENLYVYDGSSFSLIGTFVSAGTDFVELNVADNISLRGDGYYDGKYLTTINKGTPSTLERSVFTLVNTKVFNTTTLTLAVGSGSVFSSSVAAGTIVTLSQAGDDNLDRGIQFKYLNSNSAKTGFFGYDDSTGYFTFIPEATNNSNLFSGTVGEAWFKTVKLDDGTNKGIAYFNADKELTTTAAGNLSSAFYKINSGAQDAEGRDIYVNSSNSILTTNASGVPVWTNTIDGGTY